MDIIETRSHIHTLFKEWATYALSPFLGPITTWYQLPLDPPESLGTSILLKPGALWIIILPCLFSAYDTASHRPLLWANLHWALALCHVLCLSSSYLLLYGPRANTWKCQERRSLNLLSSGLSWPRLLLVLLLTLAPPFRAPFSLVCLLNVVSWAYFLNFFLPLFLDSFTQSLSDGSWVSIFLPDTFCEPWNPCCLSSILSWKPLCSTHWNEVMVFPPSDLVVPALVQVLVLVCFFVLVLSVDII